MNLEPLADSLTFVHLSDIHFKQSLNGSIVDVDLDLRNEILRDLRTLAGHGFHFEGSLISGDIAFSGANDEYQKASGWLTEVAKAAQFPADHIWMIPGNHDVQRGVVASSKSLQTVHSSIRKMPEDEIDSAISGYLQDPIFKKSFLAHLENYNNFARRFSSHTDSDQPFWEVDFRLNDGSTLRVRGLNSALISDSQDNDGNNRLAVGEQQATVPNEDGVSYLTLCHHPPNWLLDRDKVSEMLDARVHVQLFGHKHLFRLDDGLRNLRVASGAVHPERREKNWQPRYNVLQFKVEEINKLRHLVVRVFPRVWSDQKKNFKADYEDDSPHHERKFELPAWTSPSAVPFTSTLVTVADPIHTVAPSAPAAVAAPQDRKIGLDAVEDELHCLTYSYFTLPYEVRKKVVTDLKLTRESDELISETQRFPLYLERAKSAGALENLKREILDSGKA